MSTLLDTLVKRLDAEERADGRFHADCPFCGKAPYSRTGRPAQHFSFCDKGYKCFVCDRGGKLVELAEHLRLNLGQSTRETREHAQDQERPRFPWQDDPGPLLERYCGALDRVARWQAYKPLSIDSIGQYRLGVGRLPLWSQRTGRQYFYRYRRLIAPVFDVQGHCVALHGRAYHPDDDGPKWLSASGSDKRQLFVAGRLERGCMVIIIENYVDAIFAHQINPIAAYIACGTAGWQRAWTERLRAVAPRHVLVWLGHDLAGNGSVYHYHELRAAWEAEIVQRRATNPRLSALPFPQPPRPRGPQIAEQLLDAGIATDLYIWPRGTPPRADIGWWLMQEVHP